MFNLVPRNNPMQNREDRFGRLFDIFNEPFLNSSLAQFQDKFFAGQSFKVNIKDLDSEYEITAELPGIKKENIELSYDKGYLTIAAKNKEEKEEKTDNYIRRERQAGSYSRSFYVDNIDEKNIGASFEDGILKINLPKSQDIDTTKQIEIK